MPSHLGNFIRHTRECKRLQKTALARLCGWQNVAKGCRRIQALEEHGEVCTEHLERVIEVLELDRNEVQERIERDRAEYEAAFQVWADEAIEPVLLLKVAGIWVGRKIPEDIHDDEAAMVALARKYAVEWKTLACLTLNRRGARYFKVDGSSYRVEATLDDPMPGPSVRVGRQRVRSLFTISA